MNRSVILFAFVVIGFVVFNASAEDCVKENCQTLEKCQGEPADSTCKKKGDVCCKLVRTEYRTRCHHWGGECTTNRCPPNLQKKVQDCASNENCCILV